MKFTYIEAWLLESIKLSQQEGQGATLIDIIRTADYINHAILTNSEFFIGIKKLKSIGLITEKNKKLSTTEKFNEWWIKKYPKENIIFVLNVMKEIEKYLNKNYKVLKEPEKKINTKITKMDFEKAKKKYQKLAIESLNKIGKN